VLVDLSFKEYSMLNAYARSQYQEMQVQTTPGRLVVMLYDGALRFLHTALEALERKEYELQGASLGKAQAILCELIDTLDMNVGEMSHSLDSIYRFCLRRLLIANAEDRADYIQEVIGIMSTMRDAWDQAERSLHASQNEAGDRELAFAGTGR
jgi:flagellar protein FliS